MTKTKTYRGYLTDKYNRTYVSARKPSKKPVLTNNAVEVYMVFLKTKVWALKTPGITTLKATKHRE